MTVDTSHYKSWRVAFRDGRSAKVLSALAVRHLNGNMEFLGHQNELLHVVPLLNVMTIDNLPQENQRYDS